MADATARALALVSTARTTTTAQGECARRVQEVLRTHGDIASETTWQQLSRLIAEHWLVLCQDQSPQDTWTMLTRCAETALKIKKAVQQDQGQTRQEALEEFRRFMEDVRGNEAQG